MQWVMFTKHLQEFSIEQTAEIIRELGLDGLDLTVRPGGHIEPSEARELLPQAFRTVQSKGLSIPLLTTAITSAEDPYAETIFQLAAEGGVRFIKLGYWRYRGFGHIRQQIEEIKFLLDGLEKLARKYKVTAALHTHSGDFMTASGPVVAELLHGRDPNELAAYVDPRHLVAEGSLAGWKISLDLLSPWVKLIAVKDMFWLPFPDEALGKMRWGTKNCPLNVGAVPWPEVFACLQQIGFDGLVSIHSEYQGPGSWRNLNAKQLIQQTRADLEYLWDVIGGK
ncbi:MAG: sugar phosphate isomerase/epimerase [Anaerolineae bacterium]|nr:sugar phosphate isomerase/epimerase [Anaerolineae bacterium]